MGKHNKIKIFTTAYSRFMNIEDDKNLRREKLTLNEYHDVFDLLKEMSDMKTTAVTFQSGVANWFKRNGFSVTLDDGVNYTIALPE